MRIIAFYRFKPGVTMERSLHLSAGTIIAFSSPKTAVAILIALALFYFLPESTGRSEVTQ